jgi:hypothetical protein
MQGVTKILTIHVFWMWWIMGKTTPANRKWPAEKIQPGLQHYFSSKFRMHSVRVYQQHMFNICLITLSKNYLNVERRKMKIPFEASFENTKSWVVLPMLRTCVFCGISGSTKCVQPMNINANNNFDYRLSCVMLASWQSLTDKCASTQAEAQRFAFIYFTHYVKTM